MDIQAFYNEIKTDPLGRGYASMTPAQLWASLSAVNITETVPGTMTDARGLYKILGPTVAEPILEALQAASTSTALPAGVPQIIARVLAWLTPPAGGVDLGDPNTVAMINQLTPAVFTAAQAAAILAIAQQQVSRLQQLNCGDMTEGYMNYLLQLISWPGA
jgi:hypothetical protein